MEQFFHLHVLLLSYHRRQRKASSVCSLKHTSRFDGTMKKKRELNDLSSRNQNAGTALIFYCIQTLHKVKKIPGTHRFNGYSGVFLRASGRTRTGDPRITNALRYQLRYRSFEIKGPEPSGSGPSDRSGNRTRVCAVRGRRLNRLTNRP